LIDTELRAGDFWRETVRPGVIREVPGPFSTLGRPERTAAFNLSGVADAPDIVSLELARCACVSPARNASAALRTGSVDTPVERRVNNPASICPVAVMPLNGSASPGFPAASDNRSSSSGGRFGGGTCDSTPDCKWMAPT
jgi:hypothetical protein